MKSLLIFFGSCDHVTTDEVTDEIFESFTDAAKGNYSVTCADGSARAVYVYPWVYCICGDCMRAIDGNHPERE
jgi:hypothetical protein